MAQPLPATMSSKDQAERTTFVYFPQLPLEIRRMIWEIALPGPRIVEIRQSRLKMTIGEWEIENNSEWPPTAPCEAALGNSSQNEGSSEGTESVESTRSGAQSEIIRAIQSLYRSQECDAYKEAHLPRIKSYLPPPHITYVCRESLEVVSRLFPKAFATAYSEPTTYFNFELDTLFLRPISFSRYIAGAVGLHSITDSLSGEFAMTDTENLSKVQNLAISINTTMKDSLTHYVANILKFFTSVKELTLVVGQFDEPDKTTDHSTLCFDTVYDVHRAIYAYSRYALDREEIDDFFMDETMDDPSYLLVPMLFHRCLPIDSADLEKRKQLDLKVHGIEWHIPKVAYRVILPMVLQEQLNEAQRRYYEALDRFESLQEMLWEDEMLPSGISGVNYYGEYSDDDEEYYSEDENDDEDEDEVEEGSDVGHQVEGADVRCKERDRVDFKTESGGEERADSS